MKKKTYTTIKRIVLILIVFFAAIISLTKTSRAATEQVGDWIDRAQTDEWFNLIPRLYLDDDVSSGNAPLTKNGGYCIEDDHQFEPDTPYKIVSFVDVSNEPGKGYGRNIEINSVKANGEWVNNTLPFNYTGVSKDGIKQVLRLAYLTLGANGAFGETPETDWRLTGNYNILRYQKSYKVSMPRLFWNGEIVQQMMDIGVSDYLNPNVDKNTDAGFRRFYESITYAENLINTGNLEGYGFKYSLPTEERGNVKIYSSNNKYYIGPYKMSLTGGVKVGEIKINDSINAAGISTTIGGSVSNVDTISNDTYFYVVLNSKPDRITKIKAKAQQKVKYFWTRIMFIGGGASQNFIIYGSRWEEGDLTESFNIPQEEEKGSLKIIKKDALDDTSLDFSNIKFCLYCSSKGKFVAKTTSGDITFVDKLTDSNGNYKAHILSTDRNGICTMSDLPVGDYRVYELEIPSQLSSIYKLGNISMPDGTLHTGKLISGIYNVTKNSTVEVIATNTRSYFPLRLKKEISSGGIIQGTQFKLYKQGSGWVVCNNNVVTSVTGTYSNAKTLTSGEGGYTETITKLPTGVYDIYEIYLGSNNAQLDFFELGTFTINGTTYNGHKAGTATIDESGLSGENSNPLTYRVINHYSYSELRIIKLDDANDYSLDLSGVGFKVYNETKGKWVHQDSDSKITYTNYANATEFKTTLNGTGMNKYNVTIKKLEAKENEKTYYRVYESYIPERLRDYYEWDFPEIDLPDGSGKAKLKPIVNERVGLEGGYGAAVQEYNKRGVLGEFVIYKEGSEGSRDVPLSNIGFKLYREGRGWINASGTGKNLKYSGITKNFNNATVLTSGSDGYTQTIKQLPIGTYTIYEVSLGEHVDYGTIGTSEVDGVNVKADKRSTIEITGEVIKNNSKYEHKEKNEALFGRLEIIKKDSEENSTLDLSNIGFKVFYTNIASNDGLYKNKWVKQNDDGSITYTTFAEATEFKTRAVTVNGKVVYKVPEIKYLKIGSYQVYETSIPDVLKDYYNCDLPETTIPGKNETGKAKMKYVGYKWVSRGMCNTLEATNDRDICKELYLYKTDAKTNAALKGIQFKIYAQGKGWIQTSPGSSSEEVIFSGYTTNFNAATTLTTNEYGNSQKVKRVPIGTYEIYETGLGNLSAQYPSIKTTTVNGVNVSATLLDTIEVVHTGIKNEASVSKYRTLKNEPIMGTIKWTKTDEFTTGGPTNFKDVGYKIYSKTKAKWVKGTTNDTTYGTFAEAQEFKTDENGNVTVDNLRVGEYEVYEVTIPEALIPESLKDYYTLKPITVPKETTPQNAKKIDYTASITESNTNITVPTDKVKNFRYFSNFYIKKLDELTGQPMYVEGIKFILYKLPDSNDNGGWVKWNKTTKIVTSCNESKKAKASILTSNSQGITETIRRLPLGEYEIYEIDLGANDDVFELNEITAHGETFKAKKFNYTHSAKAKLSDTYAELKNQRVFVTVSGNVWEDALTGKTTKVYNNVFNSTDKDIKVNNITVKLKDRTTNNVIMTTKTDYDEAKGGYGTYQFKQVRISELSKYYVEFTYDGITYENVAIGNLNTANTSKASEANANGYANKDLRKILNDTFTEIKGEGQTITYNGKNITISYNKENRNGATVVIPKNISDRNSVENINNSNAAQPFVILNSQNSVTKNPEGDFPMWSATSQTFLNDQWNNIKKTGGKEISNVNFGLRPREKADVSIVKEIEKANLSINGYSFEYKYEPTAKATTTTTGVIFEKENPLNETIYKLPVYRADAVYTNTNKSKELSIYLTYKIIFVNNSTSLYAKINNLHEVYSTELEFERMYSINDNGQEQQINAQANNNTSITNGGNTFKNVNFQNMNIQVKPRSSKAIYIVFKLPREKVLKNNKKELNTNAKFWNYAEVGSYSLYSDEYTNLYAGFDRDSIPNNIDLTNYNSTREDDEDRAPTLQVFKAGNNGEREINGFVFEDEDEDGKVGEGNERKGDGMYTVDLDKNTREKNIKNVDVKLVNLDGAGVEIPIVHTGENGEYTLKGFIPGQYKVEFIWGEGVGTTTSDGTKVTVDSYKSTIWSNENAIHKQSNTWFLYKPNLRFSDAQDKWEQRQNLDENTKNLYDIVKNGPVFNQTDTANRATMTSETKDIIIKVEKEDDAIIINGNTTMPVYEIENVDLGLIERPKQTVKISKHVDTFKLTTAQGQDIVNAHFKDDGSIELLAGSVTGGPVLDYVKAETDTELLDSGTVATVKYKIVVENTSEIDYNTKHYYYYGGLYGGNLPEELVKQKVIGIYDYIENLKPDVEANANWEIVENKTNYNSVIQTVATREDNTTATKEWYEVGPNGSKKLIKETIGASISEIINEYFEESSSSTKQFKDLLKDDKVISLLSESKDGIEMEPGAKKEYYYQASVGTSSLKELTFNNDIEISNVERTKKVGRAVILNESEIYDRSEQVMVTPPTGENKDYTSLIVICVSALTVLGLGLIMIKK